jgi:hypothetical protein
MKLSTWENDVKPPVITRRLPRPNWERQRAVDLYRVWDAAMIQQHGPLYHREMGYTVH